MPAPPQQHPTYQGELSSYTPSWREQMAYALADTFGGLGNNKAGVRRARYLTSALEQIPFIGLANWAQEDIPQAKRYSMHELGEGNYKNAAMGLPLELGMGMLPIPGPAKGAARKAARGAKVGVGLPREAPVATQAPGRLPMPVGETSPLPTYGPTSDYPTEISTRYPVAVSRTHDPKETMLLSNYETFQQAPEPFLTHNANLAADIPGIRGRSADPRENAERYIQHAEANLEHLYQMPTEEELKRMQKWYDGANKIAHDFAARYNLPPQSVAGALAALSPQKDWFQNVSFAERVMDIMHQHRDTPYTSEMLSRLPEDFVNNARAAPFLSAIVGKRFSDIQHPYERAMFIRAFDQGNYSSAYRNVFPEGEFGDIAMNADGSPTTSAWGGSNEIGKAIASLESGGDMSILSGLMGNAHKVRNFFNNIMAPNSLLGHLTADTHAVAANQFRPLGASSAEVFQNFGSAPEKAVKARMAREWQAAKGSDVTGIQGTYPLNAEPYRRVAARHGVLPRQVQSPTWEVGRMLLENKTRPRQAAVDEIWRRAESGVISPDDARREITELAGGFRTPDWFRHEPRVSSREGPSSYSRELPDGGVSMGAGARRTSRGSAGSSGGSAKRKRGVSSIFSGAAE